MDGECPEWAIIELQGDLEIRSEVSNLGGKFVGDLHFTKEVLLKEGSLNYVANPLSLFH